MDETRPIAIQALLQIWGRRKWLATSVFAVPLTGAVSLATSLPDLYRSEATVLIERPQVSETFVRPSVTVELETRLQTISQEILSRKRLIDLMTRFDLYPQSRMQMSQEEAVEQMRRDIQIEFKGGNPTMASGGTIAFTISYRGRSPETVAKVVNTLASTYVEENLKMRERQATGTAEFLRIQLQQLEHNLEKEEQRIGAFKARFRGELPEQLEANVATLERLNTELRLTMESQMRVHEQIEREALRRQLQGSVATARTPESMPAENDRDRLSAKLVQLRQELADLRLRVSDKYPDVIRINAEIVAVEEELARQEDQQEGGRSAPGTPPEPFPLSKGLSTDAEITLERLNEEEQKLRHAIAIYQDRIEHAPRREQGLKELTRNYETTRQHYETLLKRFEDARLAETMEQDQQAERFRILESAIPPTAPSAPKRLKWILFGLMLSIALAAGAVMLAEQGDTSFHTLDELRAFTKVPVLVSIGRIRTADDVRSQRWRFCLGTTATIVGLMLVALASHHLAHGNEPLSWMLAGSRS